MPDSQRVLVLDTHRQPLMPCHPARARELLKKGKAAVFRRHPFTTHAYAQDDRETLQLAQTRGMNIILAIHATDLEALRHHLSQGGYSLDVLDLHAYRVDENGTVVEDLPAASA